MLGGSKMATKPMTDDGSLGHWHPLIIGARRCAGCRKLFQPDWPRRAIVWLTTHPESAGVPAHAKCVPPGMNPFLNPRAAWPFPERKSTPQST